MNTFSVFVLLFTIYSVSAVDDTCGGCAPGYSCQLTFTATYLHHTYKYRQCVHDSETVVPQEILQPSSERFGRSIIRSCKPETVLKDCGKERCCLKGKICSPLLFKYIPCNLKNAHKCECAEGLVCRATYSFKIPVVGITLTLKQCMEPEGNSEVREVEMTEN